MKRKVIFLAGKTGVISLPTKWLKDYSVNKGDELELTEILDGLLISKPEAHPEKVTEINIDNINSRLLFRYLNSLYKQGHTEIKVIYEEDRLNDIQKVCDYLIGMEIIKSGEKHCIIKEISSVKEGEFEVLLRRIFLMLLSTSKDLLTYIENKETNSINNIYEYIDPNINKLFKLCQRIIATERKYWDKLVNNALLTEKLERIGDLYSEIARGLIKEININQDTLIYFQDTNKILEEFYEIFYKYDKVKLNQLHLKAKEIKKQINASLEDKNYQEITVLTILKEINNQLREAMDDLIGIRN